MFKRAAEGEAGGGEPPAKKIVFQPLQLGAITNLEELDLKTLQFQNRQDSLSYLYPVFLKLICFKGTVA